MRKKAFTLIELIVAVVVIGILATFAIPSYQNFIENSKAKVCETNLKALKTALDIYAMENDQMPGDLSELPAQYLQKAYAQILREKGAWRIKLAYFIVGWQERGLAYAGLLTDNLARQDRKLITCPADLTPPAQGGISYGLWSGLAGIGSQDYQNLSSDSENAQLLIGDCESVAFDDEDGLEARHKHHAITGVQHFSQAVDRGRRVSHRGGHVAQTRSSSSSRRGVRRQGAGRDFEKE